MTFNPFYLSCLLITSTVAAASATSSEPPSHFATCPASEDPRLEYSPPPVYSAEKLNSTDLSAEQVENLDGDITRFTGDVLIERHLLRLRADSVSHDNQARRLEFSGHIHADTETMALSADTGWLNLDDNTGALFNTRFILQETRLSGKTPEFSLNNEQQTRLLDASFSSCPENQRDWHLDTSRLLLDHDNQTGTASHTVLWIKGMPVFYLPWIQFPLGDERRSGLLMPSFGSSSSSGFELSQPWYWNIAPNQDATLTPRYLRDRGNMLVTEYRFLGRDSSGEMNIEYLGEDTLLNDEERYLLQWQSKSQLASGLKLSLLANNASDINYLKDLGNTINITNSTHLERHARLDYRLGNWTFALLAQTYQTVDQNIAIDNRPYRRLPQLSINANEELYDFNSSRLQFRLNSEWVDYEHESDNKTQGSRGHVYPQLSLPFEGHAWYLKPALGFMHTQYDLKDQNDNPLNIDDRQLSISSLDSGLFFERRLDNGELLQTLEPRLFYLNIPFEEQTNIPLFDTSARDFSFASLFQENRFNGIDRIGDANQATLAVSSRVLNMFTGDELFSINLGRIFYFEDQRVSLDNTTNTANASDIVSEIAGQYQHWRARATFQWDTETDRTDKRNIQISYSPENQAVFNIGYRFYRDDIDETQNLEQSDISFAWPFAQDFSLLSRWNYSITEERDINTLVGIEYESCCWAIRLISQRYLTDDLNEPYDTSIMFQFVLKGIGSISDRAATDTLKHAIPGYQPDY